MQATASRILEHFGSDDDLPTRASSTDGEEEDGVASELVELPAGVSRREQRQDAPSDYSLSPEASPRGVGVGGGAPAPADLAVSDDGASTDFELESPSPRLPTVANGRAPMQLPSDAEVALLLRISALGGAKDVRRWAEGAADAELGSFVKALRALHQSWLCTDAALINTSVELSLLKETQVGCEVREACERRSSHESSRLLSESQDELAASEVVREQLAAQLAEKDAEVAGLTLALQAAILEQKGVAESQRKWARG